MFPKDFWPAEKLSDFGLLPGKDKGGMTCYIGPSTLYDLVNHPKLKTFSMRLTPRDIQDEIRCNPPTCLFRHTDRDIVDALMKRRFPVCVDEAAKFEPKKGDWVFVVTFREGTEKEGRLDPSGISFISYLVVEVNGRK